VKQTRRAADLPPLSASSGRAEKTAQARRENGEAVPPIDIGTRIRHARLLREARMKDVALAAGCSESLISKIESNKLIPSLKVLHRICEALEIGIGDLLAGTADDERIVTRAGERHIVEIDSVRTGNGIRLERLIPYKKGHLLQGCIHVIAPGGSSDGEITHSGEEIGYVIEGHIELVVDGKSYEAVAGDSFYFRSERAHGYRNIGEGEARVLFVNTPPTF